MKSDVYSWRLSSDLKSEIEHAARVKDLPFSTVLESAVRDWLHKSAATSLDDAAEQRRLHAAAEKCFGRLTGGDSRRSETVRSAVRERLNRRRAR